MNAATITALVTAVVALLGAISTFLAQVSHLKWHNDQTQQPQGILPSSPDGKPTK